MPWIFRLTCPHCHNETEGSCQDLYRTKAAAKEAALLEADGVEYDLEIDRVKASDYEYLEYNE